MNFDKKHKLNLNDNTKLNRKITRESVARFILNILKDDTYFKSIVAVSNK